MAGGEGKVGKRLTIAVCAMFSIAFIAVVTTKAQSLDRRLLSLVPPGAQIVAGMRAPSQQRLSGSFLLITHHNKIDLRDFIALSGVDDARVIHQLIIVATDGRDGPRTEHSLLAGGHFEQAHIFKAAVENGARMEAYRGTQILAVEPFERDRGNFNDVRWLAVIDSKVAVFGTISSVQQELDRYRAKSAPDPSLMQRLARFRRDDETWCMLKAFEGNQEIRRALGSLDRIFTSLANDIEAFQFGVRSGGHVEFEYEVTAASDDSAQSISSALTQSLRAGNPERMLPDLRTAIRNRGFMHGVIKVSRSRYERWLDELSARSRASQ